MDRKSVLVWVLIVLLMGMLGFTFKVQRAEASVAIYIKANGSVVGTDKIQCAGDTYIFVGDINGSIVIEKSNLIVEGNRFTLQGSGSGEGFCLYDINNVTVKNTIIKGFDYGVHLNLTSFCSILGNKITENNYDGIRLSNSSSNRIIENSITRNNQKGIVLRYSLKNTIFANNVTANEWGGIFLHNSLNNRVFGNDIADDQDGVWVGYSSNNSIVGNEIKKNTRGIVLYRGSSNNSVSGNNIESNDIGFYLHLCSCNKLYLNNLMDNTKQAESSNSTNTWDVGYSSGGNYWSNYTGVDLDFDGIGDSWYEIDSDNIDHYPLMGLFSSFNTSYGYAVNFISNSFISYFNFGLTDPCQAMLTFNVSSQIDTKGFVRVCIPKALINSSYVVRFNGEVITDTTYPQVRELPCSDETYTYFYINYTHSEHKIEISGSTTIPEFPSFLILPLFIIATLLVVIVYRRKHTI